MIRFSLLITALLVSFSSWGQSKKGEIVLSSAVEVSPRDVITIYDVAEARQVDREILDILKDIVIAGKNTSIISRSDLTKKLRHLNIRFVLPSEMKLIRTTQKVSRMELERKIKNHLLVSCSKCNYKVNVFSVPKAIHSDWELDLLSVDLAGKSSVMIPVHSISDPNFKGWVSVEIKKYMNVAVLNRDVKFGEVITPDMLSIEERLVNQRGVIETASQIEGMQTTRFIQAGRILTYSDLKKENVLKKGQLVKAVFGKDDFEVSVTAQSEENGAVGDTIKIKNLDSNKVFAARIEERGLVRIE